MTDFQHRQSAHCESGVMANVLTHAGLPMSEPMAFGLGSGLAFAYLPIVRARRPAADRLPHAAASTSSKPCASASVHA